MIIEKKKYLQYSFIFIVICILLYSIFVKKESFSLPSNYLTDPSQLIPNIYYKIGTLKDGKIAQQSPAIGSGMSCTQQGLDFPLIVYKPIPNYDAKCKDPELDNTDVNYDFSSTPRLGSELGNFHFTKMVLSGFTAPTDTPNIYNTFFTYTPNGTIILSIQAYYPTPTTATPNIYYNTAIKGQTNLGTWNKFTNGIYSAVINPSTYIVGGIWSNGTHYYYDSSNFTFNPSQTINYALNQGATKMLLGSIAKSPLNTIELTTFAILQQDTGGNTIGTLSKVTSQKFIYTRFLYDATWQTLPLPTTDIVTSWCLDSTPVSYASTETPVAIFSILNYKQGVSSTIYYVDILSYITQEKIAILDLTNLAKGWKQVQPLINPTTNTPRIFSEFSIGRNLKGFFIEETTGQLYACDNVGSTSPKWNKINVTGQPKLKKLNYIVNDLDMVLASDVDDNLYIDYSASNMVI
jgi:hypothetical protein